MSPPGPEKERALTAKASAREDSKLADAITEPAEIKPRDIWIERYFHFLDREIRGGDGGPIARHYLHCATAAYAEFLASHSKASRFRSWLAIRTCCQWLCQIDAAKENERRAK
jgi:hypothetical protein